MPRPRYEQIAGDLRARMESGEFPPDSKLPSGQKLMEHYGASQGTIDHAMDVLREAGFVEPIHGVGIFARKPSSPGLSEYEMLMGQIGEVAAEVRRLGERMTAAEQALQERQ